MNLYRIYDKNEYDTYQMRIKDVYALHLREINELKPREEEAFYVPGYSYPAGEMTLFECDFKYSEGYPNVNWRERLICKKTSLNNRARLSVHLFDLLLNCYPDSDLYIMEQVTPLYNFMKKKFHKLQGSEFLGENIPFGKLNKEGIRNEDATCLTFDCSSLDAILSFDVFEHVPDFSAAFSECFRVLRRGGSLMFSVPFSRNSDKTIIRAILEDGGEIKHLLEPEYHGDPLNDDGVLCYQHFGWDLLRLLKDIGYSEAYAVTCWSRDFGYFDEQIQFVAKK